MTVTAGHHPDCILSAWRCPAETQEDPMDLQSYDTISTYVREERLANIKAMCPTCRTDPHVEAMSTDKRAGYVYHHDGRGLLLCPASPVWARDWSLLSSVRSRAARTSRPPIAHPAPEARP